MTKLEQVIDSLGRCTCNVPNACRDCAYDDKPTPKCWLTLERDALEMLKAQEPRVIDISEIYTAKKLDVWIEDKSDNVHPLMLIETEMTDKSQTAFFYPMLVRPIKAYGKTWRCWSARPTDEQREAVKWDDI